MQILRSGSPKRRRRSEPLTSISNAFDSSATLRSRGCGSTTRRSRDTARSAAAHVNSVRRPRTVRIVSHQKISPPHVRPFETRSGSFSFGSITRDSSPKRRSAGRLTSSAPRSSRRTWSEVTKLVDLALHGRSGAGRRGRPRRRQGSATLRVRGGAGASRRRAPLTGRPRCRWWAALGVLDRSPPGPPLHPGLWTHRLPPTRFAGRARIQLFRKPAHLRGDAVLARDHGAPLGRRAAHAEPAPAAGASAAALARRAPGRRRRHSPLPSRPRRCARFPGRVRRRCLARSKFRSRRPCSPRRPRPRVEELRRRGCDARLLT
ncbi:uncharacterized protein SOCE836_003210 [Sorangium cellulosum]|uniref:Uncharacterized protein n=1 Tax=Sorangium cellulosum TaxID=56 RepID=A0A4P2QG58_SORCE|nr:uncharacterized protein SOCE836_003210 [Sorangium cellulosum]WCQ87645.1 hypothetical protein NQZ70_00308 [Sorangium sp. Soce836]